MKTVYDIKKTAKTEIWNTSRKQRKPKLEHRHKKWRKKLEESTRRNVGIYRIFFHKNKPIDSNGVIVQKKLKLVLDPGASKTRKL